MRLLKRLIVALTTCYLLVAVLLYFFQDRLIFHPAPRPAGYAYGEYAEETITVGEEVTLNAITISASPGQPAPGVVLYLHGNRGDNGRSIRQTSALNDLGYDLFLVDYRGFGKSSGTIASDAELTEDLQTVYNLLKTRYGEANLIVMGYSLGSGPATYLAANNAPRGAVLIAPYTSLVDMKNEFFWMFPDFLIRYELNNLHNVTEAEVPIRIVHGTADQLIPVEMSRALKAANPDWVEVYEAEGVSHRGAIFDRAVRQCVRRIIGS